MTLFQRSLKRSLDVAASLAGILALLIPGAVLAALVRLPSPGSILFVQTRMGRHGRPFRCVKFRNMRVGAGAGGPITTATDPPVTPAGRFLRRYQLDEWPQLWNVLLGHMSLVGPRPDVPGYADRLECRAAGSGLEIQHAQGGPPFPATRPCPAHPRAVAPEKPRGRVHVEGMGGGRALGPLAKMSQTRAGAQQEAKYALPPTGSLTPGDRRKDVVLQALDADRARPRR